MVLRRMVIVLALVLAACGQADGPASDGVDVDPTREASGDTEIEIMGFAFGQEEITVPAGTTVTWVNNDGVGHTVTHGEDGQPAAEALLDEPISAGGRVSFTFDEPGTYAITCTIHPSMNMIVVVDEGGA